MLAGRTVGARVSVTDLKLRVFFCFYCCSEYVVL